MDETALESATYWASADEHIQVMAETLPGRLFLRKDRYFKYYFS